MEAGATLQLRAERHHQTAAGTKTLSFRSSTPQRTQTCHPNSLPVQASSWRNHCYEFLLVNTTFLEGPLLHGGRQEQMETNSDRRETRRTENAEETDPITLPKLR